MKEEARSRSKRGFYAGKDRSEQKKVRKEEGRGGKGEEREKAGGEERQRREPGRRTGKLEKEVEGRKGRRQPW